MTLAYGEMKGKYKHREIIKSPVIPTGHGFKFDLVHNDVPVTMYYKYKNNPWRTLLINNEFTTEAIPHTSDVYLSASLNIDEKIVYSIEY
mgnify:CR=1 FL=1